MEEHRLNYHDPYIQELEDELVKEQRTKNKVKRKKEKSSYEPKRKKKFNKKHPNRI